MDATGICWSCKLARAAEFVGKSWAGSHGGKWKAGRSKSRSKSPIVRSEPDGIGDRERSQPKKAQIVQGQRVIPEPTTIPLRTSIAYPKITPGPSLFKRKLGSVHWDEVHERIQGQKRDAEYCGVSYTSCPASLNGGCCPNDRICGLSSCLPGTASAAVASACGQTGYIPCEAIDGGKSLF